MDINNKIIIEWGFRVNVPARTWTDITIPLNVSRSYCLVASGLDSDVRVSRASNIVKFYCIDANSNVEWILTGQT